MLVCPEQCQSLYSLLTGDGWSGRAEDAVLHGCVPVVIMDGVHVVFESALDWPSFSVRIAVSEGGGSSDFGRIF